MDTGLILAHLSDLHLTVPAGIRLRHLLGKRLLGYLSWRLRRRREHRREVLAAATEDLRGQDPLLTFVTGDLTWLGLPAEFSEARDWLASLGPSERVMVVPGNHDAYAPSAWNETFASWTPWFGTGGREDGFPGLKVDGGVASIGLCTACPSAPLLATGRVGPTQLARLDDVLRETGRAGLFRVLLMHHPPGDATVRPRKRLLDTASLEAVLERRGVELVLHGHAHRPCAGTIRAAGRFVPVIGAPSATSDSIQGHRRARYNVYRVTLCAGGWEVAVQVRGWSRTHQRFQPEEERRIFVSSPAA